MTLQSMLQKTSASLSLVALLAACQTNQPVKDAATIQQQVEQLQENAIAAQEKYEIMLTPFAAFDPPASTEFINVKDAVRFYLDEGLDGNKAEESKEVLKINQFIAFEELIYHEARMLGYTPAEAQSMSPRQAVKLACDLVARRMNYGGAIQDFAMKAEVSQRLQKLRTTFTTLQDLSTISQEMLF